MSFLDGYLNKRCELLGIPRSQVGMCLSPDTPHTYTLTYRDKRSVLRIDIAGSDHEAAQAIEDAVQRLIDHPPHVAVTLRDRVHVRLSNRRAPVSCRHWFSS